MASTGLCYVGNVTVKLKTKNGKVIEIGRHNSGTTTLSKAFALFMANNANASAYIPQYIDLQWIENPQSYDTEILSNWTSYLKRNVSITAPEVTYEQNAYKIRGQSSYKKNWVVTVTASLPYNLLQSQVYSTSTAAYRLFLCSGELPNDSSTDTRLAWVNIGANELSKMEPGTEALIEWQLQLVHTMVDEGDEE